MDDWCSFEEYSGGACSVEPAAPREPLITVENPVVPFTPTNPVQEEVSWLAENPFVFNLIFVVAAIIVIMVMARLLWQTKKR